MPLSLKERLLKYLRGQYPKKIAKGELARLVMEKTTFTAENSGRRLRELEVEGLVQVDYVKGHAWYSACPPLMVEAYTVPVTGEVISKAIWE